MTYRFIGNIYNPEGPEALTKLLSKEYGKRTSRRKVGLEDQIDVDGLVIAGKTSLPPSPEYVVNYIKKNWLKDKKIGLPQVPKTSQYTREDLIEMGYVGIFEKLWPEHRRAAPSTGTGTGDSAYPKAVRYGQNGDIIEIIEFEHKL